MSFVIDMSLSAELRISLTLLPFFQSFTEGNLVKIARLLFSINSTHLRDKIVKRGTIRSNGCPARPDLNWFGIYHIVPALNHAAGN